MRLVTNVGNELDRNWDSELNVKIMNFALNKDFRGREKKQDSGRDIRVGDHSDK